LNILHLEFLAFLDTYILIHRISDLGLKLIFIWYQEKIIEDLVEDSL